jgi:hypothetical protein
VSWFCGLTGVYYESIKREPKIRGINKCRCDERLQTKTKEFTRLPYTGVVYYESMKRDLKTRPVYECRDDERLKAETEESTRLAYTGLIGNRNT